MAMVAGRGSSAARFRASPTWPRRISNRVRHPYQAGKATSPRSALHRHLPQQQWQGQIVELNLDHSSRTYGRPLTANEILESWRGRAPTWDLGGGGGNGDSDDDGEDIEANAPAAFDAVNLYDLYRAMRALRAKLAGLEQHPDIQRAYLVGRPDSVMALAHLADRDAEAPIVRYLVLRELCGVVSDWASLLDDDLIARAKDMPDKARTRTSAQLQKELEAEGSKAEKVLDWFEKALAGLDREVKA